MALINNEGQDEGETAEAGKTGENYGGPLLLYGSKSHSYGHTVDGDASYGRPSHAERPRCRFSEVR